MNRRIHEVLDGDRPRDLLGPTEAAELDAYEEAVDAALAPLRAEPTPDVSATVMRRIRERPAPGRVQGPAPLRRALDWVWAPRDLSFRFRPAYALAAVAVAALLVVVPVDREGAVAPPPGAVAAEPGGTQVFVHFRLDVPDARSVQLAGDFTGWQPRHSLSQVADGVWTALVPVRPGVHHYSFVVDGDRWIVDPAAPAVDDGFGGVNSRLDLMPPTRDGAL